MTIFILFNTDTQHMLYASWDRALVEAMFMDQTRGALSFKDGKYYSPYVIYDMWVHDNACMCHKCTGVPDED